MKLPQIFRTTIGIAALWASTLSAQQSTVAVTNVAIAPGPSRAEIRITEDGAVLVFTTEAPATSLVSGVTDTNDNYGNGFRRDTFIKNISSGTVSLVSRSVAAFGNSTAGCPNCATTKTAFESTYSPVITPNGRFVLMGSYNASVFNGIPATNPYNGVSFASNTNSGVSTTGQNEDGSTPQGIYPIRIDMQTPATPVGRNAMVGTGGAAPTNSQTPNGDSTGYGARSVITPDGRYIGFISTVDGLTGLGAITQTAVPGNNPAPMAWLADMNTPTPTYTLLSRKVGTTATFCSGPAGSANVANWVADSLHISADGKRAVFHSGCNDLITGYTTSSTRGSAVVSYDVYLWDNSSGSPSLKLISGVNGSTTNGANGTSSSPNISPDGRFIIYQSTATNIISGTTIPGSTTQLYLYEIATGTTTLITRTAASATTGSNGAASILWNGNQPTRWISYDDRFITYSSTASNLDSFSTVDNNSASDVYVYDRLTGTNRLVSLPLSSSGTNQSNPVPELSGSGRRVIFAATPASTGTHFGFSLTGGITNIVARDIGKATNLLVSPQNGSTTAGGNGNSDAFSSSSAGTRVAFVSAANNIIAGDTNGGSDAFLTTLPAVGPSVNRYTDGANGTILTSEVFSSTPTIKVVYDWEVRFKPSDNTSPTNDAAANYTDDVNNYFLVARNDGSAPSTTSCAALGGGDTQITISSATYDRNTFTTTLALGSFPNNSRFKLFTCAANRTNTANSIRDAANQSLAADVVSNTFSSGPVPAAVDVRQTSAAGTIITEGQTLTFTTPTLSAVVLNTNVAMGSSTVTSSTFKLILNPVGSGCATTGTVVAGNFGVSGTAITYTASTPLNSGNYRLIACGTMTGGNGVPLGATLDGNNVPGAGVDFVRNFTVVVPPIFTLTKTSSSPTFTQGGTGSFTLTIANDVTAGSSSGLITVADALPAAYTATSWTAPGGWTCTISPVQCTSNNVVTAGSSVILTLNVNVSATAAVGSSIPTNTNSATVGGGGAASSASGNVTPSILASTTTTVGAISNVNASLASIPLPVSATVLAANYPGNTAPGVGTVTFILRNSSNSILSTDPNIPVSGGVASTTLTIPANSPAGTYNVIANYQNGGVYANSSSSPVTFSVQTAAPQVTTNPISQTIAASSLVTFTAAASGAPTPTVQWQQSTDGVNFNNISGATSTTLSFTALASQNGNQFRAVFTNSVSSATTNPATLTVTAPPVVTTNPNNTTVNAGATATFTAAASGLPTPTVQWQFSNNGGASFSNVSGATSTTLTVPGVTALQNGNLFRAVFTNSTSSVNSNAATLTVNFAPTVTTNPVSQSVSAGSNVSFTAAATGNPTPTVQWQISTNGGGSFSNISGATATTLSFTAQAGDNNNQYRAVFTNSVASTNTTAATLTVTANKITPVITWANPADILFGSALSTSQLNASTVTTAGTFTYTPAAGTVLPVGNAQVLSVLFTPTDTVNYNTATATVLINVLASGGAPANLVTTATLVRDSGTNEIVVTLAIANIGGTAANGVTLNTGKLGTVFTTTALPATLGTIAPGGQATTTLRFPSSTGIAGARLVLSTTGSYTGSTFASNLRVVLP